jgi:DNA-binding MarR family transcriptional regulator
MTARRGPQDSAGFLMWHLTLRWRAAVDRALAPLGLTHAGYVVLASLYWLTSTGDRPNQRRLAEHCALEPMTISKSVRALEEAGLVVRNPDPLDARARLLVLSEHGEGTFREAVRVVHGVEAAFLSALGPEVSSFKDQLRTLLRAAGPPSPPPDGEGERS